jgi:hypothetical protein
MGPELKFLLGTIVKDFSSLEKSDYKRVDWEKCLVSSSGNKLLYFFTKSLLDKGVWLPDKVEIILREVLFHGEKLLAEMKKAIELIQHKLTSEGITFLFFKTKKNYPYIFSDIDLLVKEEDFIRTRQILTEEKSFVKSNLGIINEKDIMGEDKVSFRVGGYPAANLWQKWTKQSGPIKIDIHRKSSWGGRILFDDDLIWKGIRQDEICAVKCSLPNREVELLSVVASLLFDRRSIPLLEFLNLKDLIKKGLDWDILFAQVKKYHWEKEFVYFLKTLDELNKNLFARETAPLVPVRILANRDQKVRIRKAIIFPYYLPFFFSLKIIIKGARKNLKATLFNLFYYLFNTMRYHFTGQRVTGWGSWYPPKNFSQLKA